MFDISDAALDDIEGVSDAPARQMPRGHGGGGGGAMPMAMPMPGGMGAPPPAPPDLPPPMMAPLPSGGGGGAATGAGLALVYVGLGLVVGGLAGGPWGAASGVAGVGAIRNLARTKGTWSHPDPQMRSEAGKSATMGVAGLVLAGFLGYQAYQAKRGGEVFG